MKRQDLLNIAAGYEHQATIAFVNKNDEYANWCVAQASAAYKYIVDHSMFLDC